MHSNTPPKCEYHTYLQLPALLDLQFPLAIPTHHDEMLFIIVHQCHELWFKQIIHEFSRLNEKLNADELFEALKTLRRIQEIIKLLSHHMEMLHSLSPDEFAGFRDVLAPASGFQSYQFRIIEYICGAKDPRFLDIYKSPSNIHNLMKHYFHAPSLNDILANLLVKRDLLTNPQDKPLQAMLKVYQEREQHSDLHFLFENLIDLDTLIQMWRTMHVKIAERMIGRKMGTGGSTGVDYLSNIMSKKLFPELWDVRSHITSQLAAAY